MNWAEFSLASYICVYHGTNEHKNKNHTIIDIFVAGNNIVWAWSIRRSMALDLPLNFQCNHSSHDKTKTKNKA